MHLGVCLGKGKSLRGRLIESKDKCGRRHFDCTLNKNFYPCFLKSQPNYVFIYEEVIHFMIQNLKDKNMYIEESPPRPESPSWNQPVGQASRPYSQWCFMCHE